MTELLYQADAYLQESPATVEAVEGRTVRLDRTVFYPQGGGQPGDCGVIVGPAGETVVGNAIYSPDRKAVLHVVPEGFGLPAPGQAVLVRLDWSKRWPRMRIHTALHLLTAVLPYPVTGGAIGEGEGRLDFDIPDAGLDRAEIERQLQALVNRNAPVSTRWISDDELLANPGLVKTMSVKPPMGTGRVRLVAIGDIDLQPCGGTHVAETGAIGRIAVTGIEKKGKLNRRIRIALA